MADYNASDLRLHPLPAPWMSGGAEGIRTDGHRGRGEISSWIAAWGFARPLKAALGGGLVFRSAASRFRREHRHPERRHPEELPLTH
jgi:hypothetical protein